ncbi:SAM-dependent chlorinase/fluorinase [Candidatus Sumerlaeota bacterium]|nr:SAM-dependent chlorinase/fluorinase [Candidatus Sumerlaeota bacterium]
MTPRLEPPLVALLTDMGLNDWYVGTMQGVILSICPKARLVNLCHGVTSQQVEEAAFVLNVSHGYFPAGTIFLCVVDPEVGSQREAIVAHSEKYYFVAPNNGLLSLVAMKSKEWEVRAVENPAFKLVEQSQTFHGRDVFAPAAARLAQGEPFESVGGPVENMRRLRLIENVRVREKGIAGRIMYIDTFGNLLTNVTPDLLPGEIRRDAFSLAFKSHVIRGITPHYAAVPSNHPLMYWGSSGVLEIAINRGSAARKWDARLGEWFDLEWP